MILISIIFQSLNSNFLSAGNIVNLLVQGSIYMLLAMAEVYVLLLGEIDLSAGFVAGVSGVITAELLTDATRRLAVVRRVPGRARRVPRSSARSTARSSPASACRRSW